jgi:hypothetical protein
MSRRRVRHSTVPTRKLAKTPPPHGPLPARPQRPRPATAPPARRREVGHIFDESETSLVDVIDNLLNRGVVLNADIILALADVDLVYLRLSALLCAADRIIPAR